MLDKNVKDLKFRIDEFIMLNNLGCLVVPNDKSKDYLSRAVKLAYCIDDYFKSNSYDIYSKVLSQFITSFFELRLKYVNEVIKANGK